MRWLLTPLGRLARVGLPRELFDGRAAAAQVAAAIAATAEEESRS